MRTQETDERPRPATSVDRRFQRVADEMLAKADRIRCTLEERERGLHTIMSALDMMLQIVREERLRS